MTITDLLSLDRVVHEPVAGDKRAVFEALGARLAAAARADRADILACLSSRERLGSTGLGRGVAIPHGRLAGLSRPVGVVMKLAHGVEFDAPDGKPVDILFALLVPMESTETHLELLAQLAELFADGHMLAELRATGSPTETLALLNRQVAAHAA
jgi:PTS system nitrogen regulatory IIA component